MSRNRGTSRLLAVIGCAVMALLGLPAGCGTKLGDPVDTEGDRRGPDGGGLYTDGKAGAERFPLCEPPGNPCTDSGGFCFDVCGTLVLVQSPPSLSGFAVAVALPANLPRATARSEAGLISIEQPNLVVREPDTLLELGSIAVGRAHALVVVGATAFVREGGLGGVTVVDVGDPAHPTPMAWWAAATTPPPSGIGGPEARMRLVGASDGRLVVSTERGVSLLDVSDPYAPAEALCVAHAEGEPAWTSHVLTDGRWLVVHLVTDGDEQAVARVHDLQASDPTVAVAELSCLAEGFMALHNGRLLVAVEDEAQLYDLAAPSGPALLATRGLTKAVPFDASVVGGFAHVCNSLTEAGAGVLCSALDMESEDLAGYTVQLEEETPCLERLVPWDAGEEWVVSPWYAPDLRWPVAQSPVHSCPAAAEQSPLRSFDGVLAPEGDELLVHAEDGDWLVDLGKGKVTAVPGLQWGYSGESFPSAVWIGDRIAMLAGGPGGDWGIVGDSRIEIHDRQLLDGPPLQVDSPGTILDLAVGGTHLYVLSEPKERAFGDPDPPLAGRLLWSVDLGAVLPSYTELPLPAGAAPTGVAAAGETLYVLDAEAGIRVLDTAGYELRTVDAPAYGTNGPHSAGLGGLLVLGGDGVPRWLPPNSKSLLDHVDGCAELVPVAADGDGFCLRGRFPGSADFASRWDFLVAAPVDQGDGFVFEVKASAPLGQAPTRVLPGEPAVIIHGGLVLVQ